MGHISTGLQSVRRSPFQAMAAISVLSLTFFVTTLLAIILYSSNQVLNYFATRPQVIVFLQEDATDVQRDAILNILTSDERVEQVTFVSKEEALAIYREATADNPLLGELVSPSIFPASIEFSVIDLNFTQEVIDEITGLEGVDNVSFTANLGSASSLGDVIERLKTITYYIRVGGLVAVLVLAATSFLVLLVVMGMRITMRRYEIENLTLIGATPGFIRMPIIFEAVTYAVFGVIIGWLLASVLVMYATPAIMNYFGDIPVLPERSADFFLLIGAILGGELLVGLVIALMGSMAAVSRSLHMVK